MGWLVVAGTVKSTWYWIAARSVAAIHFNVPGWQDRFIVAEYRQMDDSVDRLLVLRQRRHSSRATA